MKHRSLLLVSLAAATLCGAQPVQAQSKAQSSPAQRDSQQREEGRRLRDEQMRHVERQRMQLELARRGEQPQEREHQTIDFRTQALPAAPAGHEWQRSESGDYIFLVRSATGVIVQVMRNVTPQ